ncbi:hypothetical protein EVAR_30062_1 [Eumeta japonica]|uniref:Uncharacterized protein n=1 Tax=Eumeta variegata TaxID=151549 RepID=A0A4C1X9F9_EUMVA|nr:hypothetical protein EVAR_30062_1 [Eumeta japonica]
MSHKQIAALRALKTRAPHAKIVSNRKTHWIVVIYIPLEARLKAVPSSVNFSEIGPQINFLEPKKLCEKCQKLRKPIDDFHFLRRRRERVAIQHLPADFGIFLVARSRKIREKHQTTWPHGLGSRYHSEKGVAPVDAPCQ